MAAPHISPFDLDKSALRARLRAVRRPPHGEALMALERHLEQAIDVLRPDHSPVIAAFLPIGGEPDLSALLARLHAQGLAIALPDTPECPAPLRFRRWWPGCAMRAGRFGTLVPQTMEIVPELLIVPLLGFDADLHRLGQGGGFYDRTLAALPGARSVGVGIEALLLDSVPVGPHDIGLDAVATETRLRMKGGAA
ncbi:5-formyltetrahydrofolate cyclo-ligase [Endobacter medicaginis]|uniref:5-formyltetrahydrofolate cyclo-ligase n=2 Tax=Endobacter medicaginis TaxID=1181271 RepID=A0A850NJ34_9PROT|nr:5-formyltetrahydrofolate cyclo-ligase [Endobacter medicaginis]MCX5475392.1 5-formyltetrahydrofolate cyclo-ligase [Endobacter medicaginis]NVN29851.1 5-formyltetrahydrofolate cyclo-ligase [Endobacter medicaginis]